MRALKQLLNSSSFGSAKYLGRLAPTPAPFHGILRVHGHRLPPVSVLRPNFIPFHHIEARTFATNGTSNAKSDGSHRSYSRSRRALRNIFLYFLLPYTSYALYVSFSAFREVQVRNEECSRIEADNVINHEGTLCKYKPLRVLSRFENPFDEYRIQTIYEFFFNRIVELFDRSRGGIPSDPLEMSRIMPVHKPDWTGVSIDTPRVIEHKIVTDYSRETHGSQKGDADIPVYNTWLGQSCNYVVYNGLKVITDPIFSDHLINKYLGPKRITGMPCTVDEVPTPDVILVSHNHPDHLDYTSLKKWGKSNVLWIVPKGMGLFMRAWRVENFVELSWWETCELTKGDDKYQVSCTPAMHWSGRYVYDTNQSLWCSFMLSHHNKPIMFHAGDTGYVNDLFKRISHHCGDGVKLALLPCGQYCPEWHQKPRHIGPSEVIQVMNDMKAQNVLGVHWGTFILSGEPFLEPKQKLEALSAQNGTLSRCYCPELGKTIRFG